jgi:membrane-associated phospholipid phosphatase
MRYVLFLAVAVMISTNGFCQLADSTAKTKAHTKVYHVNYYVTGSIIVVGTIGDVLAIQRLKGKPKITSDELTLLTSSQQKNLINPIDRWALEQDPSQRDLYKKISDIGQIPIFLLPTLLIIDKKIRKDWLDLLLIYYEGHVVTFSIYNYSPLGPTFINRYRPFVYYNTAEITPDYIMSSIEARNSFFSGHVNSCAYSTFFMAKVYCDYHPELRGLKYLLYLAAAIPPMAMGIARVKSLDHFPSDDAVGFAVGATLGIVIPALHKIPCSKYLSVSMATSPNQVGLSVAWKLDYQSLTKSTR